MNNQETILKVKTVLTTVDEWPVIYQRFEDAKAAHEFIRMNDEYLRHNIPAIILN